MLKKHAQFFKSLFIILDLFVLSLAWIFSYVLRFYTDLIKPPTLGMVPFMTYLTFLLPLLMIWGLIAGRFKLYRPRRMEHFFREYVDVSKSLTLTLFIMIAIIYLFGRFEFSRLAFFYFWVFSFLGLMSERFFTRKALKVLRSRGYNRRFVLIAGTGSLGQKVLEKIGLYPELGIEVVGFLTHHLEEVGKKIKNIPVVGRYEDLDKFLSNMQIDIFFIALSIHEYDCFETLFQKVQGRLPEIKVVPGSYEFLSLRGGIDELGDLPIISLQTSPLYGWDRVFKRAFDLIVGSLILVILSPIMVTIGILIKLTSKGPILYKQERLGFDGLLFQMLKFRTMHVGAEMETGPIWAKENDPRRTKLGAFLRKTSLDELPQLFNVLKGEMSLVGPRPERPNFVEEFRNKIPLYMLRHKIKAGMTGWAQVNGWRGNTSLQKRIEHDLYYIQNWSIGFDLRILSMTLWRGFFSKSAY
ncbi:MAG: undecaprenyl-phosphate glucose phosphotransferase [Syntrophaceae bacterium]|nr:undecaprenyl-phosphate glucose phosphotransferase [Syntrophaceae bacterium]